MMASGTGSTGIHLLSREDGDDAAVVVRDVKPWEERVVWLPSAERCAIEVLEAIPFGSKVALADLAAGDSVVEYGVLVDAVTMPVRKGSLVHTHSMRSCKWQHDN